MTGLRDPSLGRLLFDIPVYRVSPEQWEQECERAVDRIVPDASDQVRRLIWDTFGSYSYSQIMGWVNVRLAGPMGHVKCYYHRVDVERITRRFRKDRFREFGKVAELRVGYEKTPEAMTAAIRTALVTETRPAGSLRGRHLDLEAFDALAPALDLRRLIGI